MNKHWIPWFEIPVNDLQRATKFYETIFDIKIHVEDLGELKMGVLPHGNSGGALIENPSYYKPSSTHGPLLYLDGGDDLLNVSNKVEAAGGKIEIAKRQISAEHGYMAIIIDTEGNRIALHSMS